MYIKMSLFVANAILRSTHIVTIVCVYVVFRVRVNILWFSVWFWIVATQTSSTRLQHDADWFNSFRTSMCVSVWLSDNAPVCMYLQISH